MAVDLADYVDVFRRAVNAPGAELFPDAVDSVVVGYLSDAFWTGRLVGFFTGFDETEGIITPETSGDPDITRDKIQLIVFLAELNAIENELTTKNTSFSAKAGPVEYETQNSAQLLRDRLRALYERRDFLIEQLSDTFNITYQHIDYICARTNAVADGLTAFNSGVSF